MQNAIPLTGGGRMAGRSGLGQAQVVASKPKLLDQLRGALRSRQYSRRTEQAYIVKAGLTPGGRSGANQMENGLATARSAWPLAGQNNER